VLISWKKYLQVSKIWTISRKTNNSDAADKWIQVPFIRKRAVLAHLPPHVFDSHKVPGCGRRGGQELMRHASFRTTMDRYTQALDEPKRQARTSGSAAFAPTANSYLSLTPLRVGKGTLVVATGFGVRACQGGWCRSRGRSCWSWPPVRLRSFFRGHCLG
jgi:hypothetical protein